MMLVLASMFLLLIAMIETRRSSVKVWKGSQLPLLVMDVEPGIKQWALMNMDTSGSLKSALESDRVVLEAYNEGGSRQI